MYTSFEMLVNFYLLSFKETFNEADSIKSFIKKLQNKLFLYTDCFRIYVCICMYCMCIETAHTYTHSYVNRHIHIRTINA